MEIDYDTELVLGSALSPAALLLLLPSQQPIRSQRIAVNSPYEFVPSQHIYIPPIDSQNVVIYRVAYIEKKIRGIGLCAYLYLGKYGTQIARQGHKTNFGKIALSTLANGA